VAVGSKRAWLIVAAILVPLGAGATYWFAPYTLFINDEVNEPAPKDMTLVAGGDFQSLEHQTRGRAEVFTHRGERPELRLVDLHTSNGPALHVILSSVKAGAGWSDYGRGEIVDLGPLKGNIGTSYYPIPAGIDPAKYASAVVWCKRFGVGFGVAPLGAIRE
jgi:Electron transfer DM13